MQRVDIRVQNRMIIMLLFPVSALLWLVGWVLICSTPQRSRQDTHKRDIIETGIVLEEFDELEHAVNKIFDKDS